MNHPNKKIADETAFDNIESREDSAWLLGFLIADGCLKESKTGQKSVTLAVAEFDRDAIDKFISVLRTNAIPTIEKARGWSKADSVRISVTSPPLFDRLCKLGVIPRKTGLEHLPAAHAFNHHVWRGVIDGDGSLSFSRDRKQLPTSPIIQLAGCSRILLGQFVNFSESVCGRRKTVSETRLKSGRIYYSCQFTGDSARVLIDKIYTDSVTHLDRKYAKSIELLKIPKRVGWKVRWGYE